jgi:hypothetical protein
VNSCKRKEKDEKNGFCLIEMISTFKVVFNTARFQRWLGMADQCGGQLDGFHAG